MNQKLHRNIIYQRSLRLSLLLIQNQCPKLPPIQLSVYAICMGVGGKGGGCSRIMLKTAHCKVQLTMSFAHEATKNPIFQGFLNQQFQTKKTIDSCI